MAVVAVQKPRLPWGAGSPETSVRRRKAVRGSSMSVDATTVRRIAHLLHDLSEDDQANL